jgi:hypothetical protein
MRSLPLAFMLCLSTYSFAQMLNDSSFNASVSKPKYKRHSGPHILIDAGHHNFIVEMGLIKPFAELASNDGYRASIDSGKFTSDYLAKYQLVLITPAMPFKFGSKKDITDEITFTNQELVAIKEWVSNGGSLIILSEHAPIDKSMTPLLNTFDIQTSVGAVFDPINCDTTIKLPLFETILKFTTSNGLLNRNHPITTGTKKKEAIQNIETYTGSALTGPNYSTIFKLGATATIRKWNGISPKGEGDSQCLAGHFGNGKIMVMGDCNGFTAMYVTTGGKRFYAGMQVEEYDWKQFVLNTIHWLSE